MRKKGLLFAKLKQCQTLKEIAQCIPDHLYDKWTVVVLLYWCFMPFGSMLITKLTHQNADLFMYVSSLGVGFLGVYLTILRSLKVNFGRQLTLKDRLPQLMLSAMLLWSLLASFHARNYYHAFIGESYSHEGFLTYVAYAGVYGMTLFLVRDDLLKKLMIVFTGVGTILSILTIFQYAGYHVEAFSAYMRLAGIFHNTNHFGYYLVLVSLCASGLSLVSQQLVGKVVYQVCFMLILSALILNNTFGAYLGVLAGVCAIAVIFSIWKRRCSVKFFIPLMLAMFTTVMVNQTTGLVANNFNVLESDVEKIVTESEDSGNAGSFRWALWVAAMDFIAQEPLLGHGPDNLDENYAQVGITMLKPHNEYIQHAACLGIPALIFYLVALMMIYVNAYLHRMTLTPLTVVALCVVSGYLVSALFGNTKFYVTPYFMMFLAISAQSYIQRSEREC